MLAENVLAQMTQIRMMNRKPKALRCDVNSFDCLIDEIGAGATIFPVAPAGNVRIYGLEVEITSEPNFEVVD